MLIQFIIKSRRQISSIIYFKATYKIYQLKIPLFEKILSNELLFVSNLFKKNNFELKIAGGAVTKLFYLY